jgi:ribosome-binding factor A
VQTEITRGLNDPRVQGMVSITAVDVTPDLAEARLKVSVLPEERASLTLSGLRAAAGFLRRRVMDETRIGRVPRLLFDLDAGLKRESALEAAIRAARHHEQDGAHDAGEEKRHDESESKTT